MSNNTNETNFAKAYNFYNDIKQEKVVSKESVNNKVITSESWEPIKETYTDENGVEKVRNMRDEDTIVVNWIVEDGAEIRPSLGVETLKLMSKAMPSLKTPNKVYTKVYQFPNTKENVCKETGVVTTTIGVKYKHSSYKPTVFTGGLAI